MDPITRHALDLTRRQFFARGAGSLGAVLGKGALATLLGAHVPGRAGR